MALRGYHPEPYWWNFLIKQLEDFLEDFLEDITPRRSTKPPHN